MAYAIEFYFDPLTTRRITDAWHDELKQGSEYLLQNDVPPHVALAVMEECGELTALQNELASLSRKMVCFHLQPRGVSLFDGELPTLYLAFQNEPLLDDAHAKVAAVLERLGVVCHEYYRRPMWIPHCSLAQSFPKERVAKIVAAARWQEWQVPLQICQLALVAYPPTKVMGLWPLQPSL